VPQIVANVNHIQERRIRFRMRSGKQTSADIADQVMENPDLLEELLNGVSAEDAKVRFGSAKALRVISEKNPQLLYPRMSFFADLLDSENNILKWIAIDIIGNLTAADTDDEFNRLFEKFYGYLHEGSLITAGHVVDSSGSIALSKPDLAGKITHRLLAVEGVPLPTTECRNILAGKAIRAFGVYFDKIESKDKDRVLSFVRRQLRNSRNATRTRAEKFLAKFG
jgi:hypothetical protein